MIRNLLAAAVLLSPAPREETRFLFCYFRGNGEDGLHLACSADGRTWTALNEDKPFLRSQVGSKLMRDPCILQGPDGTFHLVWTSGWTDKMMFGYAASKDLVSWSEPRAVTVMEDEPRCRNVWAPELFYDDAKKQFLVFWSSTIPGKFPETDKSGDDGYNHRVYSITTRDFQAFTKSKLLYDGGFNVIDATMVKVEGKYILIVKDETKTPVKKNLRAATADTPEGPFSPAGEPFTISWVEGPSILRIGDEHLVYFDHYARPQYYGAVSTKDFKTWTDVSKEMSFTKGCRHGTIFQVPKAVADRLPGAR
jgi:beta-xylosidase